MYVLELISCTTKFYFDCLPYVCICTVSVWLLIGWATSSLIVIECVVKQFCRQCLCVYLLRDVNDESILYPKLNLILDVVLQ